MSVKYAIGTYQDLSIYYLQLVLRGAPCSMCTYIETVTLRIENESKMSGSGRLRGKIRHQKCIDLWKTVMSLIFSIVKIYRGWKYHLNFENQHWFKNQGVNTHVPFGLKSYLELCSLNFASFFYTETQPSFVIRRWYPHSYCQWHEEDLSDSWIKDTRWKVMVVLWCWTLHCFTLQSLHLDWWYFLHCGNDFWQI